jgi:hypothetical protein
MTNRITPFFRLNTADQLKESFDEPSPTRLYMFMGGVTPFANDSSPPAVTNNQFTTEFDVYKDMVALKRINSADVISIAPRYNWTNNTIYTEYNDRTANLYDRQFYVLTSENNVYKCIDNNRGAVSQPTAIVGSSYLQ